MSGEENSLSAQFILYLDRMKSNFHILLGVGGVHLRMFFGGIFVVLLDCFKGLPLKKE